LAASVVSALLFSLLVQANAVKRTRAKMTRIVERVLLIERSFRFILAATDIVGDAAR
jgi:hypothetical protein